MMEESVQQEVEVHDLIEEQGWVLERGVDEIVQEDHD